MDRDTSPGQGKTSVGSYTTTPVQDTWRLGLLEKYLATRRKLDRDLEDTKDITSLIDSLCVN